MVARGYDFVLESKLLEKAHIMDRGHSPRPESLEPPSLGQPPVEPPRVPSLSPTPGLHPNAVGYIDNGRASERIPAALGLDPEAVTPGRNRFFSTMDQVLPGLLAYAPGIPQSRSSNELVFSRNYLGETEVFRVVGAESTDQLFDALRLLNILDEFLERPMSPGDSRASQRSYLSPELVEFLPNNQIRVTVTNRSGAQPPTYNQSITLVSGNEWTMIRQLEQKWAPF